MTTMRLSSRFSAAVGTFALLTALTVAVPLPEARADDGNAIPSSAQEASDDGDGLMRILFEVNKAIDTLAVRPIATFYKGFTPPPAQEGLHNVASNLRSPLIFANDVLQGENERAAVTLERALINTTAGFLGWNDKAAEQGLEGHDEDFGQTLAVWGMEDGPYMVLPVIGPSNPRDAIGTVVDFLTMPPGVGAVHAVDKRAAMDEELETIERTSLDHYAAIRSMYEQNRRYEIANRKEMGLAENEDFPDIDAAEFEQR